MKIKIKGINLYKSKINKDSRGYFTEIYKKKLLKKNFIFHCLSSSKKFLLRGLNLQIKNSKAKNCGTGTLCFVAFFLFGHQQYMGLCYFGWLFFFFESNASHCKLSPSF